MKSNIATAAFLFFCILIFGFQMNSCKSADLKGRFEYSRCDLDAKICGTVDGDEVEVILKSRPSAAENEYGVTLIFESPAALDGLVISRAQTGICEARLGELVLRDFDADGFLEPFLTLLYSGEISSIKRDAEGNTAVTVKDGERELEYVFRDECEYPYSIKGRIGERSIALVVQSLDLLP